MLLQRPPLIVALAALVLMLPSLVFAGQFPLVPYPRWRRGAGAAGPS